MRMRLPAILIGIAGAIVLGLLIAPGIIGSGVRDATVGNVIALFPPQARQQLVFEEETFDGGWFRSTGQMRIRYQPLGRNEQIVLTLDYEVSHGPLLATPDGLRWGLAYARLDPDIDSAEFAAALAEVPFPPPELTLNLLVTFDQSLQIDLAVTPVRYQGAEGEFIFDGISARLTSHADQSADFDFAMGTFSAGDADSELGFSIGGITMQSHSDRINDMLAPFDASLTLSELQSNGPFPFTVGSIDVTSRLGPSSAGGDLLDISQHIRVNEIDSELPVQSVSWYSRIDELQSELILSYYTLVTEFQDQLNTGNPTTDSRLNELGEELVLVALRNRLVFSNEVQASAYGGEHTGNLDLAWAGLATLNALGELDAAAIISALTIDLAVALDLEAVMRSPLAEMVDPYVQEGYIDIDNGRILLTATLRDNELTLNGEVIALDQFIDL